MFCLIYKNIVIFILYALHIYIYKLLQPSICNDKNINIYSHYLIFYYTFSNITLDVLLRFSYMLWYECSVFICCVYLKVKSRVAGEAVCYFIKEIVDGWLWVFTLMCPGGSGVADSDKSLFLINTLTDYLTVQSHSPQFIKVVRKSLVPCSDWL